MTSPRTRTSLPGARKSRPGVTLPAFPCPGRPGKNLRGHDHLFPAGRGLRRGRDRAFGRDGGRPGLRHHRPSHRRRTRPARGQPSRQPNPARAHPEQGFRHHLFHLRGAGRGFPFCLGQPAVFGRDGSPHGKDRRDVRLKGHSQACPSPGLRKIPGGRPKQKVRLLGGGFRVPDRKKVPVTSRSCPWTTPRATAAT